MNTKTPLFEGTDFRARISLYKSMRERQIRRVLKKAIMWLTLHIRFHFLVQWQMMEREI